MWYLRRILYYLGNTISGTFILFGVFIFFISLILYNTLNNAATEALIDQFQVRELELAESGAASINSFLTVSQSTLSVLSSEMSARGEVSEELFNKTLDRLKDTSLVELVLFDPDGKVDYKASRLNNGMRLGESYSEYDFFNKTMEHEVNQFYIGSPQKIELGDYSDQYTFAISVKVDINGEEHVLTGFFMLSDLTENFINPLLFANGTRIYLIDEDGVLLHSPYEETIGQNYYDNLKQQNFLGGDLTIKTLKEASDSNKSGTLDIALPNGNNGKLERFLIAYAPVTYNGHHWTLYIDVPQDVVINFIAPYYFNQLGFLIVSFIVVLIIFVAITTSKAYKEGYIDYGRDYYNLQKKHQVQKNKK